ncbi:MAG: hemolysin family protein [Clostridia bacterium]|nr:hemolysin family protein [Clostridia bacterium]
MRILPYIVVILTVLLSAFFSATELAMTNMNKLRLEKAAEEGDKRAKRALKVANDFDKMLSSVLIGNNLVNILCSSMATIIFIRLIPGNQNMASTVSTIVMTVIILIFGEIVPKLSARNNAENFSKVAAVPIQIIIILFYPIVMISVGLIRLISKKDSDDEEPTVTEDELVDIIDTVEEEGVIDEESGDILRSAIEFKEITLAEVLKPRTDMVSIDIDRTSDEILKIALRSKYSRIPVFEDSIDNIIGVLYLNRYLREVSEHGSENVNVREMLVECSFFHKAMRLPVALKRMRETQMHLAIVVDEFGGTMGIVTLEDILEEIVGEIWDESDDITHSMVKTAENTFEVAGDMNVYDFFEELEMDEEDLDTDYTTVGGWAIEMLDGDPHEGDSFTYKNLYVVVTLMQDMRVMNLTVLVNNEENEEE